MFQFYFLRGAIGDENLLREHRPAIERLLREDYTKVNLEKLVGYDVYSFRLSRKKRLLFTLIQVNNKDYLLVLDYLPNHNYHNSPFLRSGMLAHYLEKNAAVHANSVAEERVFQPLLVEEFSARARNVEKEMEHEACAPIAVDYYQKEMLVLNPHQREALQLQLPAVISGIAGSGKSCVALSLLMSYLLSHPQDAQSLPLLYVTRSKQLAEKMNEMWEELPLAKEAKVQIKTYDELLIELVDEEKIDFVGEQEFKGWYSEYRKKEKVLHQFKEQNLLDAEVVYQEFRICSSYSENQYLGLGERQSLLEKNQKPWLYKAYQRYSQHLQKQYCIDPALHPVAQYNRYALIVVDEAQDLSHQQLKILNQLAVNHSIVYYMDSHQRLFDKLSVRPYLLQMLGIEANRHVELLVTYRCPLKVVRVANEVITLKQRLAGGLADKYEATKIGAIDQENDMGEVFLLTEEELHTWLDKHPKGNNLAIITSPEHLKEARKRFATPLIFTPKTIKGLEYDTIVAYQLFPNDLFKKANQRLRALGSAKQPIHQAKAGAGDDQFGPGLNCIYTSYTRAKRSLVVFESPSKNNQILLEPIRAIAEKGLPSIKKLDYAASQEDWEAQALIQLKAGNEALSFAIFQSKLEGDKAGFNVFIKKHQAVPVASLPEQKIPQSNHAKQPPSREESQVLALYNNFEEQRLIIALRNLDAKALLLTSYQRESGEALRLIDIIRSDPAKIAVFSRCLANHMDILMLKVPFSGLLQYLKKDKKCLLSQHLIAFQLMQHQFLCNKKTIPVKSYSQYSPAWAATLIHAVDILKTLNKLGADLNKSFPEGTISHLAAQKGICTVLQALGELEVDFNKTDSDGSTPAHIAAGNAQADVLFILGKFNANFNKPLPITHATPVHVAAEYGHANVISILKKGGANLDQPMIRGYTAAFVAVDHNRADVLLELHKMKADLYKASDDGTTPLLQAIESDKPAILAKFYQLKGDLNEVFHDGIPPLFFTLTLCRPKCLQYLMDMGINPNQTLNLPPSVWIELFSTQSFEVQQKLESKLIQRNGMDPRDNLTLFPMDLATSMGNVEIIEILKQAQKRALPKSALNLFKQVPVNPNEQDLDILYSKSLQRVRKI